LRKVALRFSLPQFFHIYYHSIKKLNQSINQKHKVIYMFHSANFFSSYSEVPKPLVRYSLYTLNSNSDKQHPCLTPLPAFMLLVCLWFSPTLTLCSSSFLLHCWPSFTSLIHPFYYNFLSKPWLSCLPVNHPNQITHGI